MPAKSHGMSTHPLYRAWNMMRERCHNPRCSSYRYYGAKGITVCDSWRKSFAAFYADMGDRPEGHSIDRIDSNGNYTPENCRWATPAEQSANSSRVNQITHDGITMNMTQWSAKAGLATATVRERMQRLGMTFEEAITAPKSRPWGLLRPDPDRP